MAVTIASAGFSVGVVTFFGGRRAGMAVAAIETCVLSWRVVEAVRVSRFFKESPRVRDRVSEATVKYP